MAEPPKLSTAPRAERIRKNPGPGFSKAFDNFVSDDQADLEGLLAYALYKRTVRDQCRQGVAVDGRLRDPPKSEVDTYRSSAREMIETVLTDYENDVRADLQASHYDQKLEQWKGEIKATIRNRTSPAGQIVVNLIAWMITLGISLIVYFAARAMTVDQVVAGQAENRLAVAADTRTGPDSTGAE